MQSNNQNKLPQVLGTIHDGFKCIFPSCPAIKSSTRFMSSIPAIISFPSNNEMFDKWVQDLTKYLPDLVISKSELIVENNENGTKRRPRCGLCSNHFHKSWHGTIKDHLEQKEKKQSLKNLRPCAETIRRFLINNMIPEVLGTISDGYKCILPNCEAKNPQNSVEKIIVSFPTNEEKYQEWIQIIRKYLPKFDPERYELLCPGRIPMKTGRPVEYSFDIPDKPEFGLCSSHFHKSWNIVIKSHADELKKNKKKTNNKTSTQSTKKVQMKFIDEFKMAMSCGSKMSLENLKPCEEAIRRWLRRSDLDHKIDKGSLLDKDGNYQALDFKNTNTCNIPSSSSKRSFQTSNNLTNLSSPFSSLLSKKSRNSITPRSPFEQDSGFVELQFSSEFNEENFKPKACSTPKHQNPNRKRPRKELNLAQDQWLNSS